MHAIWLGGGSVDVVVSSRQILSNYHLTPAWPMGPPVGLSFSPRRVEVIKAAGATGTPLQSRRG